MKKIMIVVAALMLMAAYGCSGQDSKKAAEEKNGAGIVAPVQSDALTNKAAEATDSASKNDSAVGGAAEDKATEVTNEDVTVAPDAADNAGEKAAEAPDSPLPTTK